MTSVFEVLLSLEFFKQSQTVHLSRLPPSCGKTSDNVNTHTVKRVRRRCAVELDAMAAA